MWRHLAAGVALALSMSISLARAVPTDDGPILPGIEAPLPPESPRTAPAARAKSRISRPAARETDAVQSAPRGAAPNSRPDPFDGAPAQRPVQQYRTGADNQRQAPGQTVQQAQPPAGGYQQLPQKAPAFRPQDPQGLRGDPRQQQQQQRNPRMMQGPGGAQRNPGAVPQPNTQSTKQSAPLWRQPSPSKAKSNPQSRGSLPQAVDGQPVE